MVSFVCVIGIARIFHFGTSPVQVSRNKFKAINYSLRRHSTGLTFLGEGNLSCDGVNGEHVAGWNPGRLLQEAKAKLGVDGAALVPIQSLHLHKRDP